MAGAPVPPSAASPEFAPIIGSCTEEAKTGFSIQMRSNEHRIEGHNHFPQPLFTQPRQPLLPGLAAGPCPAHCLPSLQGLSPRAAPSQSLLACTSTGVPPSQLRCPGAPGGPDPLPQDLPSPFPQTRSPPTAISPCHSDTMGYRSPVPHSPVVPGHGLPSPASASPCPQSPAAILGLSLTPPLLTRPDPDPQIDVPT